MIQNRIDLLIKIIGYTIIGLSIVYPLVLLIYSLPLFSENSIIQLITKEWRPSEKVYGIKTFIITSLLSSLLAIVPAFFISLSTAVFIDYKKETYLGKIMKKIVEIMSGIPTVIYGFCGIMILLPFIRTNTPSATGHGIITTSIMLAVLILPTVIIYIYQSILMVPNDVKLAAKSLGCDSYQYYFYAILPFISKGMIAATIMGFSRAISDTMIALMLSGNSFKNPDSIFSTGRTLTSHIALIMPGEFDGVQFKIVFFSALILVFIIVFFNLILRIMNK